MDTPFHCMFNVYYVNLKRTMVSFAVSGCLLYGLHTTWSLKRWKRHTISLCFDAGENYNITTSIQTVQSIEKERRKNGPPFSHSSANMNNPTCLLLKIQDMEGCFAHWFSYNDVFADERGCHFESDELADERGCG